MPQRLRRVQVPQLIILLGPLDFPVSGRSCDRLKQTGSAGYSQVTVSHMVQRIAWRHYDRLDFIVGGSGSRDYPQISLIIHIGIVQRTPFCGYCCARIEESRVRLRSAHFGN